MKYYKENFKIFLKNPRYIIPILIVSILSFGFVLTHYSINIDSLSEDRYFKGNELLAQGRFTSTCINAIFNIMSFNPFFVDFLAVIFLIVASIVFCILIKKITNDKFNLVSYIIFSCLFVSYPLIHEIFKYTPASLSIGLGFFGVAISLALMYEFTITKNLKNLIFSMIILIFLISLYESFAAVYLCGVCIITVLELLYVNPKIDNKKVIKKIFIYLILLIIVIIEEFTISRCILTIFDIQKSEGIAINKINILKLTTTDGITNFIDNSLILYVFSSFYYFPITMLNIAVLLSVILGIKNAIKYKKIIIFFAFLGMIGTLIVLPILMGGAAPYRTCQVFQLFVPFIFMIFIQSVLDSKWKIFLKNIILIIAFILIFYQAKDLHKWFYINYIRYEDEKAVMTYVCSEIRENYSQEKPVIFIGDYEFLDVIKDETYLKSDSVQAKVLNKIFSLLGKKDNIYNTKYKYVYRYVMNGVESTLNWGKVAFREVNVENAKFAKFLGYKLKTGATIKDYNDVIRSKEEYKGRIISETDKYIIVNLSEL